MNKIIFAFALPFVLVCFGAPGACAADETRPPKQEGKDLSLLAISKVRNALPPAPSGWAVSEETKSKPLAGSEQTALPRFHYAIIYKRITGMKAEQAKLDGAYAESSRRNQDAAKPQIEELIKQQTRTSLKLRKAGRRKNQIEQKRLNEELEENGKKMRAVHEEVDKKISRDVEPYLMKDAEATISVALNDEVAELQQAAPFAVKGAAFALQREGERLGITGWQEDKVLILFGDWQQAGNNLFEGTLKHGQNQKARTVKITITGARKRVEQLLTQMDLKAILSLMQ